MALAAPSASAPLLIGVAVVIAAAAAAADDAATAATAASDAMGSQVQMGTESCKPLRALASLHRLHLVMAWDAY